MKLKTKNPRLRRGFGGQEKLKANKGIVALPVMLLLGGIIVEIGIAGLLISYFFIQSNLGIRLSAEALAAAQSGIQDATIKIIRDKNFTPGSYSINIGNRSAQITVCKDTCAGSGKHQVTSLGIAQKKQRQIQAILNVNSTTGEVKVESIKEIAI
ncbi:MAG: hypothetical protein V3T98_02695 [Candidatus Paceibacterota bacterium]